MSVESEATAEVFDHAAAGDNPESSRLANIGTAAGLTIMAGVTRFAEQPQYDDRLPKALQLAVNSGAHPILGFVGGLSGKFVADRLANGGRRAYIALGLAGAVLFDIATEFAQDSLLPADQPFYSSPKMFESSKDMLAAGAGFLVALVINRNREPAQSPQE